MQAELKAVQQQALATQQALQKLQTQPAADPYTAITAELPGLSTANSAVLGLGSALALGVLVVWWYLWHRPGTRMLDAAHTATPPASARAASSPPSMQPSVGPIPGHSTQDWAPSTASGEFSFDSEAAATEVMRVRKSLAEKREARAHFLEREEADGTPWHTDTDPGPALELDVNLDEAHPPSAHAWLDQAFTDLPDAHTTQPVAVATQPKAGAAADAELDLDLDPWRQPGESPQGDTADPAADAIHFSLTLEDYGVQPDEPVPSPSVQPFHQPTMDSATAAPSEPYTMEPDAEQAAPEPVLALEAHPEPAEHAPDGKTYDFTITLALAQESAALELWSEARDLASEVLESEDPALVSEALSLLERLNQQELNAPPDTNWNTMR